MRSALFAPAFGVALALAVGHAQTRGRGRGRGLGGDMKRGPEHVAQTVVPKRPVDIVLGRPTGEFVTLSVLAYSDMRGCVVWGTREGEYVNQTAAASFRGGEPVELVLKPLKPDTRYYYRFQYGGPDLARSLDSSFHTQRPLGETFVFTVQADAHLDQNTKPELYARTLVNALADRPDFHIDLGDTFMTGKYRGRKPTELYLAQRYYFGLLCHSAPLFLVPGNHDGEPGGRGNPRDGAIALRKKYFANPVPDGFYTGNGREEQGVGPLEDYYAWEWGDALFVVLDPFWYSRGRRGGDRDNWFATLGEEQYRWLAKTLEGSKARFRLVFIHHLVGGENKEGRHRGGVEAAKYYEWGGHGQSGAYTFEKHRPGWAMPIQKLLVRNRVGIVFHGHDHFFAKQDLDGIVYQLAPQPGHAGREGVRGVDRYGYLRGEFLGSSGHLRVCVSPKKMTVDYVRSRLASDAGGDRQNGAVDYSYTIPAGR